MLHLSTHRSFEISLALFLMFWTQVTNQLELTVKMCSVRIISSYIHQLFHSTRSSSLSLWLKPSPTSNWLKFADGVNIVTICTYLQSVCVKSQRTWFFEVHLFRLVMLANALSANCKSAETESKYASKAFMQITGYNFNDLWSRDVCITNSINKAPASHAFQTRQNNLNVQWRV